MIAAQNTISERDDTIKNLGTEIDALKKTLSANEKHSQEAADFKDKFEEKSSALIAAQNTISERDDTIKNLGTEIDALKKTLSANEKHSQEAADFKDKLKVALEDKKDLQSEVERYIAQHKDLSKKLVDKDKMLAQVNDHLSVTKVELEKSKKDIVELQIVKNRQGSMKWQKQTTLR